MIVQNNGDLKWKTEEAIDEAYRRGYEDGKQLAMKKIKDYNERQNEEIKVGDEVKVCDCIGIVTRHAPKTRTCYVMYRDGSCGEEELTDCEKTGNHSMSLDKWLEQMRKERHEV